MFFKSDRKKSETKDPTFALTGTFELLQFRHSSQCYAFMFVCVNKHTPLTLHINNFSVSKLQKKTQMDNKCLTNEA